MPGTLMQFEADVVGGGNATEFFIKLWVSKTKLFSNIMPTTSKASTACRVPPKPEPPKTNQSRKSNIVG